MVVAIKNYAAIGRNIFLNVADFWTSRGMLIFYFWALFAVNLVTGAARGNIMVWAGYGAGFASMILHLWLFNCYILPISQLFKYILIDNIDAEKAYNKVMRLGRLRREESWQESWVLPLSAHAYLIVVLGIVPLIFSSIITVKYPWPELRAKYAVVSEKVVPLDGTFVFSSPFAPVIWINNDRITRMATLTGHTRDNVPVAIKTESKVLVPPKREAILDYAKHGELHLDQFDILLQIAFRKVVASMDFAAIPNGPLLTNLIYRESLKVLDGLPLVWNGEFSLIAYSIIRR